MSMSRLVNEKGEPIYDDVLIEKEGEDMCKCELNPEEVFEENRRLHAELNAMKEEIDSLRRDRHAAEEEIWTQRGMIEGLKFAIRCNGVSGGEVH
jgi:predicted nuclease with TOPRIM domain